VYMHAGVKQPGERHAMPCHANERIAGTTGMGRLRHELFDQDQPCVFAAQSTYLFVPVSLDSPSILDGWPYPSTERFFLFLVTSVLLSNEHLVNFGEKGLRV